MKNAGGSALIYVLIAVALFAALGFAMTRMTRGSSTGAAAEKARLQASEILQYARGLRTAIQTMQVDNTPDTGVSFETPALSGYVNAACAEGGCRVFAPDGGNMSYAKPLAEWLDKAQGAAAGYGDWLFSGHNAVAGVGLDDGSAGAVELTAILPWLRKDLCLQINGMLGIANPADDAPKDGGNVDLADKFTGAYSAAQAIGGGDPQLAGQRTGCFQGGGTPGNGTYHFYQVLIAR